MIRLSVSALCQVGKLCGPLDGCLAPRDPRAPPRQGQTYRRNQPYWGKSPSTHWRSSWSGGPCQTRLSLHWSCPRKVSRWECCRSRRGGWRRARGRSDPSLAGSSSRASQRQEQMRRKSDKKCDGENDGMGDGKCDRKWGGKQERNGRVCKRNGIDKTKMAYYGCFATSGFDSIC